MRTYIRVTTHRTPARSGFSRRGLLAAAFGLAAVGGLANWFRTARGVSEDDPNAAGADAEVEIEAFAKDGTSLGVVTVPKIVRTEAGWKAVFAGKDTEPLAFEVTRHEGTERAYSGRYADHHASGIYTCIGCDTALFDSATKYESGTGWPSFWQPISPHNVTESTDFKLILPRTEIACARCDAHLGHVFSDGPEPTGLRYCMNSAALGFTARA